MLATLPQHMADTAYEYYCIIHAYRVSEDGVDGAASREVEFDGQGTIH